MITCDSFNDQGFIRLEGIIPPGHLVATRSGGGVPGITLRNGELDLPLGGFTLEDSEAPVGVPITYRATVTPTDRVIQRNLMLTPNFGRGVFGWVAGTSRTLTTVADSASHSGTVGNITDNSAAAAIAAAPTIVGNISSTAYVTATYTLTPPTTGGTPIATNDWVYIVHTQYAITAAPAISGFTTVADYTDGSGIRVTVFRRKRLVGDTGYTVTLTGSPVSNGTCFWVRTASDDVPIVSPVVLAPAGSTTVQVNGVTNYNPAAVVTVGSAATTISATLPVTGNVTGGPVWNRTLGTTPNIRSTVIAHESVTNGGVSKAAVLTYNAPLANFVGLQISIPNATAVTNRVIAKAKAAALPAAGGTYRFTGRFKYTSAQVWTWADVLAQGTWSNLRSTKTDWAAVRSTATVPAADDYSRMFVAIVNPATGTYYVNPVQAIGVNSQQAGTWIDFNFYFTTGVDIPTTAEVWFIHGTATREYASTWRLEEIGITSGSEWQNHDALYFLSGDTSNPGGSADRLDPAGEWFTASDNSAISWTGTAGNSTSQYLAPTTIYSETQCQIDMPDVGDLLECGPVIISDPVSTALGVWAGLGGIDTLTHPSRQQVYEILGRAPSVAVSQVRGWEVGGITLISNSLVQRTQMLDVLRPGRVVLLRNTDDSYPENNWYLAIGDVKESRISTDARDPLRSWDVPFVRVERPGGLIEVSSGVTWAEVMQIGTWSAVRAARSTWLDVMTADA